MKDKITRFIIDDLLSGMQVSDQDDLLLNGLIDSIGVMRLVSFIEVLIDKPVPPEDVTLEHFVNIDAIYNYIEQRES